MHRLYLTIILILSVAVVYLAVTRQPGSNVRDRLDRHHSIAVFPFVDLEGDAAAPTTSRLTELLVVDESYTLTAPSAVAQLLDRHHLSPEEIAEVLGVSLMLEGSARTRGDRIAIAAQLIDAGGEHLWSKTYEIRNERGQGR